MLDFVRLFSHHFHGNIVIVVVLMHAALPLSKLYHLKYKAVTVLCPTVAHIGVRKEREEV